MITLYREYDSPVGRLCLSSTDGKITGLTNCAPVDAERGDTPELGELARQLDAYFAGALRRFDVPLALRGTGFRERVWTALREIPYGKTRTYGAVAQSLGNAGAARAVGQANRSNPVWIVVPCHRVIGADGSLAGYAGGAEMKRFLLDLERSAR